MYKISVKYVLKRVRIDISLRNILTQKRDFGGYIEDAQLSLLALEIYQDIHGKNAIPSVDYKVEHGQEIWPVHLWGYELGKGYNIHILPIDKKKEYFMETH